MELLLPPLGVLLLAMAIWDIAMTVLHPSRRGPLTYRAGRGVWLLLHQVAARWHTRMLTFTGPAALAAGFVIWIASVWLGYALIYVVFMDHFSYDPTVPFGHRGLDEALYMSAVALTTVGYGDLVAASDWLRLLTVSESAVGLAVITAAITYLLSVYPLVTRQRQYALQASDLGLTKPEHATLLVTRSGPAEVANLQRCLLEAHQDITRFPVLYYFQPDDQAESMLTLLHSGVVTCLVLRWGLRADAHATGWYARPLEATVRRVLDDYEANHVGGSTSQPATTPLDSDDAATRLKRLRDHAARVSPDLTQDSAEDVLDEFAAFCGWADSRLRALAREYRQPYEPLLSTDG